MKWPFRRRPGNADPLPAPSRLDVTNMSDAQPASVPGATYKDISELQKHGIYLAWGVLAAIGALALVLVVLVAIGELWRPPPEVAIVQGLLRDAGQNYAATHSPEALLRGMELLDRLAVIKRASRDFWTSFSQLLLLNLLLPVLTAILGYVFGTIKSNNG
jgi:hypothetical protein